MPFFSCYLLTPVQPPRRLRCTYIGFTTSPARRVRQHNGEIVNGARRTRKFRPWEMVAIVHGFPSKFRALQFEWIWQHPLVSKISKPHFKDLKGFGTAHSLRRKIVEMLMLVNLKPFRELTLTVSFTNVEIHDIARGLRTRYAAACCETRAIETFAEVEKETKCFICESRLHTESQANDVVHCFHPDCEMCSHVSCLTDHFRLTRHDEDSDDQSGECPACQQVLTWRVLAQRVRQECHGRKRIGGVLRQQTKKFTRVEAHQVTDPENRQRYGIADEQQGESHIHEINGILPSSTSHESHGANVLDINQLVNVVHPQNIVRCRKDRNDMVVIDLTQ